MSVLSSLSGKGLLKGTLFRAGAPCPPRPGGQGRLAGVAAPRCSQGQPQGQTAAPQSRRAVFSHTWLESGSLHEISIFLNFGWPLMLFITLCGPNKTHAWANRSPCYSASPPLSGNKGHTERLANVAEVTQ